MPRFNKSLKLKHFEGVLIPASSKRAVRGDTAGVYFFWKGEWYFTAINGFYIEAQSTVGDFDITDFIGDNEIVEFKQENAK